METEPRAGTVRESKYLVYIAILFAVALVISNTTASKLIEVGPFIVSAAIIIFPLSFIFGDILTEVYGYKASRKVVWGGLAALVLMTVMYWIIRIMPGAQIWEGQAAFDAVFGAVPRITAASILAYFVGEFANSFVLSRMKVWMQGKHLWMRTIGSTIVGEGADSIVFYTIAFIGVIPFGTLMVLLLSSYFLKVLYEIIATPLVYPIVGWLKRKEGMDIYDRGVNYNPFTLAD